MIDQRITALRGDRLREQAPDLLGGRPVDVSLIGTDGIAIYLDPEEHPGVAGEIPWLDARVPARDHIPPRR